MATLRVNESEQRLSWAPEPNSSPIPTKREVKNRSGKQSRKRYGWRNTNSRQCPVYSIIL